MRRTLPERLLTWIGLAALLAATACAPAGRVSPGAAAPSVAAKPVVAEVRTPRDIFLARCSKCHDAERGYAGIEGKESWSRLVERMAAKDPAWLPAGDVRSVIAYREVHSAHVGNLFRAKCGPCHQSLAEMRKTDKSPAQWRTMINFMGKRSPEGLSREEAEAIFWGLTTR
jgi:mono/diheme cytochrome c family protein